MELVLAKPALHNFWEYWLQKLSKTCFPCVTKIFSCLLQKDLFCSLFSYDFTNSAPLVVCFFVNFLKICFHLQPEKLHCGKCRCSRKWFSGGWVQALRFQVLIMWIFIVINDVKIINRYHLKLNHGHPLKSYKVMFQATGERWGPRHSPCDQVKDFSSEKRCRCLSLSLSKVSLLPGSWERCSPLWTPPKSACGAGALGVIFLDFS